MVGAGFRPVYVSFYVKLVSVHTYHTFVAVREALMQLSFCANMHFAAEACFQHRQVTCV